MSAGKRYRFYAIWKGEDGKGYKKRKAYYIHVTLQRDGAMTMIFANDEYKEYEGLIQFLWEWDHIKLEEK